MPVYGPQFKEQIIKKMMPPHNQSVAQISSVTDAVMSEVTTWQAHPLEAMHPVVFFDALRVKIRENGVVRNKAVYLALGVLTDGSRDTLGI